MTRRRRDVHRSAANAADTLRDMASKESDPKFARDLYSAADQLERTARSSTERLYGFPRYSVGLSAAIRGLQQYKENPGVYAPGSYIGSNGDFRALDPNDSNGADNKCNRFVADMIVAAGGSYPVRGSVWPGRYPASAEEIYSKNNTEGMRSISAKEAKVGDIISFPGHIGIYLGNGVYVSARGSGVEVSRVPWNQNPRFLRPDQRVSQRAENTNGSDGAIESSIAASRKVLQSILNQENSSQHAKDFVPKAISANAREQQHSL
jgi:hypothetical protein